MVFYLTVNSYFILDGNAVEVMTYDVLNNVTTIKVGHGHLWRGLFT
jgi:hypothetical protein